MKHILACIAAAYVSCAFASAPGVGDPADILAGALQNMREKSYVASYHDPQGITKTTYHRANPDGTADERTDFLGTSGRNGYIIGPGGRYRITPENSVIRQRWLEKNGEFSEDGETFTYSFQYPVVMDGHECYEIGKTLQVTGKTFAKYAALPQNKDMVTSELEEQFERRFPVRTVYYVDKRGMFLRGKTTYSKDGKRLVETRYGDVTFRDDFPEGIFAPPQDHPVLIADSIEEYVDLVVQPGRTSPVSVTPPPNSRYYKFYIYAGIAGLLVLLMAADICFVGKRLNPALRQWWCRSWALCGLFGLLWALAYPSYNLWWLAFVAFVPLFLVIFTAGVRRACLCGFAGGTIFASINLSFLLPPVYRLPSVIGFITAVLLMGVLSLIFALAAALLWRCFSGRDNRYRHIWYAVCVAACFVLLEAGRTFISPWNFLAVTQYKNRLLLQLCSLGGIYMVSFAVMLINAWLAVSMFSLLRNRRNCIKKIIATCSLPIVVLIAALAWKTAGAADCGAAAKTLNVGLVQTDFQFTGISPERRRSPREIFKETISLIQAVENTESGIDVIILPECAMPILYSYSTSSWTRVRLHNIANDKNSSIIFGNLEVSDGSMKGYHNMALLLRKSTRVPSGTYDKMEPVPLLEFVPPWLSFLNPLWRGRSQAIPGNAPAVFELPGGLRAGINICYDDVFPYIARLDRLNGASLLVVIANDSGFGESEKEQHFANAVFRAVENGIPMVRSCNAAPSLVIGADGTILDGVKPLATGTGFLDYSGSFAGSRVISVAVPDLELTFFSRHGNWFLWCCGFILIGASGFRVSLFFRKKFSYARGTR